MAMFYSASTNGFYDSRINKQMPADAVELTDQEYRVVMASNSNGNAVAVGLGGKPTTVEPVADPKAYIKKQIVELERTITPRRMREAVLGIDNGWLKTINDHIAALRGALNG